MVEVPGTVGNGPGPAVERRQAREEVERFEQELGRAVVKRALEPVHDQAVAVAVEPLECERGTRDIAA